MARSIDMALSHTIKGRKIRWEARQENNRERDEIRMRIRTLKELTHSVFVKQSRRWDVFDAARSHIRDLGRKGGEDYEKALSAVKYAMASKKDYFDAIQAVAPGHQKPSR